METHDWQSIQKQKIRKCIEEQLETEERMETLRKMEINKALQEISQGNKTQAEAPAEDNKEKVAIDTYETVLAAKLTEDSKGNLITQEPDKIMRVLNNPMRDNEDIDESDESLYYRFQQAIDIDMAEPEFDPQQLMEEEINKRAIR